MTSIIKVDNLQNQCGANIISESANVITIGASGDTVTLAAGASQSGFGRSGSVNWDTTAKTTGFTAVSGNGYFCNTTSAAFTVTLPLSPSAGAIVAIADYADTSATNNITVGRNGSKINGENLNAVINVNGQVYTLVYVDATEGWKTVGQTFNQIPVPSFVAATGGTVTCCGNFKIHTFTGPGTFTVTNAGNPSGSATVDYLVVAGGGGSGRDNGGAGGAGGFRYSNSTFSVSGAPGSPLASATALPVSATGYPITVGAGGGTCAPLFIGIKGNDSIFSTITSTGGGFGVGCGSNTPAPIRGDGQPGGSGGGAGQKYAPVPISSGGTGNSPPVSPSQGNPGGSSSSNCGGGAGGGGAMATGNNSCGSKIGGVGAGLPTAFGSNGVPSGGYRYYAGGGGGGGPQSCGAGGPGGLGGGGAGGSGSGVAGTPGTANTGGGAGGGSQAGNGGTGGSGIVVIRYKFQ
jgi:hypothetical protein